MHKAHREELEAVLFVLDKLLTLLPELISKRWQSHSLTRLITKLLHPGNSHKLRREAIRYVKSDGIIFLKVYVYRKSCLGFLKRLLRIKLGRSWAMSFVN